MCDYNGTTWSVNPVALGSAFGKGGSSQAGTQTAALIFAGGAHPGTTTSFSWDGAAWTSSATMNANMTEGGSCGTQGSAMGMGGEPPGTGTEEYTSGLINVETITTS